MKDNGIDKTVKLYYTLINTAQIINERVDKPVEVHGLNQTEFAVLQLLYFKGAQPLQKIGQLILLSSGSITYVVDKLESKELLERSACSLDRRVTYAQLTDDGNNLLNKIFPDYKRRIYKVMATLSEDDQTILLTYLQKLMNSLEKK